MRPSYRRPSNVTPPPRSAVSTTPGATGPDLGLEAEIFWDRHKAKVLGALVLALAAILGYSIFLFMRASALASANAQLSAAKTIDELKKVVADHPASVVAGDAYLVLAQKQAEAREYEAAASSAQTVTEKYPDHPLVGAAWLAVGANLEAVGKLDQADLAYKTATDRPAADFAVPLALLARANLAKLRGNTVEARRFLDDVLARYPGSGPAMQAEQDKRFLRVVSTPPAAVPAVVNPAPAAAAKPDAAPVVVPAPAVVKPVLPAPKAESSPAVTPPAK